jgi:hypothetical protein
MALSLEGMFQTKQMGTIGEMLGLVNPVEWFDKMTIKGPFLVNA